MRAKRAAFVLLAALLSAGQAAAGLLTAGGTAVLDAGGAPRASFTNTERITFQQKVHNGVTSTGRITFTFIVLGPSGSQVFSISGNSVPGSVGNAATQLSGFQIAKFYSGPGIYTMKARAELDSQVIEQQSTFVVSSPNILLLYPPNGAQNIADTPLTFRWSSSGGSSYRVTVADNPSLYNAVFSQTTQGSETFLSYPTNPPDPRQRLAAGQLYYWKVEGLDASGQKVAESAFAYSFTVQTAALGKDIAVVDLSVTGAANAQGELPFNVAVKNQGGTAQGNVPLRFSVGGLPAAGTPVSMTVLSPGETRQYSFAAPVPTGQNQSLSIACVEFSDDNLNNNCKTLLVNRPADSGGGISFGGDMSPEQIWQAIRDLLSQRGVDLTGYNLVGMEGRLSAEELRALLDSIRSGQADVSLSGPPANKAPAKPIVATPGAAAKKAQAPAASSVRPDDASIELGTEWSGFTPPLSAAARGIKISDPRVWKKIWKHLRGGGAPELDFDKHMIVGVVAGKGDRADSVEFESIKMQLTGLVIRYKLVVHTRLVELQGPQRAAMRTTVPYYFKVAPKSTSPVDFEPVEEPRDAFIEQEQEQRRTR